jgi:hypothetical protein
MYISSGATCKIKDIAVIDARVSADGDLFGKEELIAGHCNISDAMSAKYGQRN